MSVGKVFKVFESVPRSLAEYERVLLEEIVRETDLAEDAAATPDMILAQARTEAARKVQEAFAEGVRRGIEAGRAQYIEAVAESAAALKAAADAIREANEQFLNAMEPHVVDLAGVIARRVLQREADTDRDLIRRTVRKALEHLLERERVVIHVNPKDFEALRVEKVKLLDEFDGVRQITVQPDETITPGGCVVDTDLLHVDARIEAQLEAIMDALRQAPE